jgi:Spy/CpxP family protein refolding chaperone
MNVFGKVKLGLAIAGVLLAGTALAQAPGGGMGVGPGFGEHRPPMERAFGPQGEHGRWWNNPKLVERLKLTEEQRKAFDGILLEHREKLIDLRGNMEKTELQMEPLMSAEQPNEARILAQIDKVAQARAELEKANARFLLEIRAKLTPEQWKLLQADRANHRPERRDGDREGQGLNRPGTGAQFLQQVPLVAPPPPPPVAPQGEEPLGPGAPGAGEE